MHAYEEPFNIINTIPEQLWHPPPLRDCKSTPSVGKPGKTFRRTEVCPIRFCLAVEQPLQNRSRGKFEKNSRSTLEK